MKDYPTIVEQTAANDAQIATHLKKVSDGMRALAQEYGVEDKFDEAEKSLMDFYGNVSAGIKFASITYQELDPTRPLREAIADTFIKTIRRIEVTNECLAENSNRQRSMAKMSADQEVRDTLKMKAEELDAIVAETSVDLHKSKNLFSAINGLDNQFVDNHRVQALIEIDGDTSYDGYMIDADSYMSSVGQRWLSARDNFAPTAQKVTTVLSDLRDFYDNNEFVQAKSQIRNLGFVDPLDTLAPKRQRSIRGKAFTI